MDERPRLRHVEAFPVQVKGERSIALRDPAGWTDSVLVVSQETTFVLTCFDGSRTLREVQEACFRRFGEIVPVDQIQAVAEALDTAFFLDSETFRAHRSAVENEFLAGPVRPASHAGGAYDADPAALRSALAALIDGASAPPAEKGAIVGLVAPHIDLRRGGAGYGAAYRALRERCRAGTYVILGTAHAAPEEMFIATRKAFATPLGSIETDADFIEALARRHGSRLFHDEITHRNEHSIEFQAVFLRHLFADRPIRIVPILCSSFHESVEAGRVPREDPRVADFLGALGETLAGRDDVCLVAAADLAHLGPRFGDGAPVSRAEAGACEEADRRTLEAAARRDPAAFFGILAAERDRRRVCGISPIYTLLESLDPGAEGSLLHYGQAIDPGATTFVSFASMAFTLPRAA
jgi:AmmeMemoRadiSam system protein B